jgi:hypothetical protein
MRAIFVNVEPHDYALRVDAQGYSALVRKLVGFRASTRDVERSYPTVSGPQKAMIRVMAVVAGTTRRLLCIEGISPRCGRLGRPE